MNLITTSVLLLAMLAFQPTLIYGLKGSAAAAATITHNGHGKKHSPHSAVAAPAKLVMSMHSGDVFVRTARGAATDTLTNPNSPSANPGGDAAPIAVTSSDNNGDNAKSNHHQHHHDNGSRSGIAKRPKKQNNNNNNQHQHQNNNNSNRKYKKNSTPENAQNPNANGRRQQQNGGAGGDKKFSAAGNHQQGNNNNNNNKTNKKQLVGLKSQQHQTHGKRSGVKSKSDKVDKSESTCRYTKGTWSECDIKTNVRSRILTLRRGDENCLPTRTVEKKCKKSCRYEKGTWTTCTEGQMTRQDKLKSTGDAALDAHCKPVRDINKNCNPSRNGKQPGGGKANKERKNKEKASRHTPAQPA